jgi:RNA-directed DNA polymerase
VRKYYSLIDKIYHLENLRQAYRHVRSHNGALGVDGETVKEFGDKLEERLQRMHRELAEGTYQPSPVRRTEIDKEDGSKRCLSR